MREFPGRTFEWWMYRVSHGELLVRSPRSGPSDKNVDIKFVATTYVELPRLLPDFEVGEATSAEDLAYAAQRAGDLGDSKAFVFRCADRRYLVVAAWMRIAESDMDIFELPGF